MIHSCILCRKPHGFNFTTGRWYARNASQFLWLLLQLCFYCSADDSVSDQANICIADDARCTNALTNKYIYYFI